MKKRIIIIVAIAVITIAAITALLMTVCKGDTIVIDNSDIKSDTAYFNFFGSRFDLSDSNFITEYRDSYETAYRIDYSTFKEYIDSLKKSSTSEELTYIVARVKCKGDLTQKFDGDYLLDPSIYGGGCFYTEIPFEVVQVLEVIRGDETLLNPKENISVRINGMFLDSAVFNGSWKTDYKFALLWPDKASMPDMGFKFYCDAAKKSQFPRTDYEYVLVLRYSHKDMEFTTTLRRYCCELSTLEDYAAFKATFGVTITERHDIYYEILDRYNIKIKG